MIYFSGMIKGEIVSRIKNTDFISKSEQLWLRKKYLL